MVGSSSIRSQQQPPPSAPAAKKFMTLEEVEASMKRQNASSSSSSSHASSSAVTARPFPARAATLEEIEASLKNQTLTSPISNVTSPTSASTSTTTAHRELQPLPSNYLLPMGTAADVETPLESTATTMGSKATRKRGPRRRKDPYRGIMSREEKDLITRIQLSQLASDDPFLDDFYYQSFIKKKQNKSESTLYLPLPRLSASSSGGGRRSKPKGSGPADLSLQGALGKISGHSVRNPRQLLKVEKSSNSVLVDGGGGSGAAVESLPTSLDASSAKTLNRQILKTIETCFMRLFEMEDLKEKDADVSVVARKENEEKRNEIIDLVFKDLFHMQVSSI